MLVLFLYHLIIFIASISLSCFLLCIRTDFNQCLTTSKIASTIIVTLDIIIFTFGKQRVASTLLPTDDESNE